ncbi:MAG TPA: SusE domain-containing protein, partial [Puia sp.]|nr:SusE domain-containing protein [Puia sp.]
MLSTIKSFFLATALCALAAACSKVGDLPSASFVNGKSPVLTDTAKIMTPQMADSNSVAVILSWSNPQYATDSATAKYIIEIDSSGRNFAKEATIVVTGARRYSFTAKQFNAILLGFGFAYNTGYKVDIRITSSYANNNQQLLSNTVTLNFTTYVVPPKVAPPSGKSLFLVGSAS